MPDPMVNNGVFDYLTTLLFIEPEYNNVDYLYNRSGDKLPSPLVSKLADNNTLTTDSLEKLANVILMRYRNKWNQLFRQYSNIETIDLLKNISLSRQTIYGKGTVKSGSDILTKTGTESDTTRLDETRTESYNNNNPRKSSRMISGSYTDNTNETTTRSGTEEVLESFPTERKSRKTTTGGYSDTDTITNTRSGSQKVTDKGGMETSVYGFNSSNAVPSQVVVPENSELGTTSETTFGQEGLKDTHSGAITRAYNPETGLVEETSETGQRKMATTYGQDGLRDALQSGSTRTYNNYKDEVTESGEKTVTTSYGQNGKTVETSFNNRQDSHTISGSVTNSGTDTVTESGYKYKSLIEEYVALFNNSQYMDFFDVVYSDIDEVLTCPIFV